MIATDRQRRTSFTNALTVDIRQLVLIFERGAALMSDNLVEFLPSFW